MLDKCILIVHMFCNVHKNMVLQGKRRSAIMIKNDKNNT